MPKLIVCLTGMPGAGKSTICSGLEKKGFTTINMGDAVRAEAKRRNLDPTGQNLGKLMLELREKEGQGAVAKLIEDQITNSKSDIVVIDGVRSNAEIDVLKKIAKLKLLAVHASTDTRYTFLSTRHRSDDPQNRQSFDERDNREIGVGISASIALADETLSNNNLTVNQLIDNAYQIITKWLL
ncbi:MAG TPA: AAA family ATPase [Candidatus Nitrosotenuis sp.]|nr:AAA family ATPase [Candidatus Nitrosotenuis sp.]